MALYRCRDGATIHQVEADTWCRDFASGEVVFVRRRRGLGARTRDDEVLRLSLDLPHRHIERLPRQSGDL